MNKSPTAGDYMTEKPVTFAPEMEIRRAVQLLLKHRISGAPVLDREGTLVGILSKKDCMKVVFSASYHQDWGGKVSEYMSRKVETVDVNTDIVALAERFLKGPYRRFPVLDNNRVVGQISRHDVLRALEDLW